MTKYENAVMYYSRQLKNLRSQNPFSVVLVSWERRALTISRGNYQYHNYDKLGYLPAEGLLDNDWYDYQYDSPVSGISTNKRAVLNSQGDTAFLIVGVGTGKRQKQYYLWSVITIEEVLINEEAMH
ncbi:MAG TPA: hypothetical protein V6D26_26320 [Stenomitos sp.]